ncbi:hypothetical protein MPER_10601 [Moniliophthora perniciosa FA553]|nr:hypothetical protein MPER_10601 [Moniliophthora perniciosa FA553]
MAYQSGRVGGSAVLNYSFLNGTDYQRSAVRKGMDTWSQYANVIFQSTNSADIRISFSTTEDIHTCLGTTARNVTDKTKQTMRLKGIDTDAPKESKKEAEQAGLILHELGHVLGLLHEHQSPARGGRIKLDVNAVLRHYRIHYPGWTDDDIQQNVIIPYERAEAYNMSSLDMNSIMMQASSVISRNTIENDGDLTAIIDRKKNFFCKISITTNPSIMT